MNVALVEPSRVIRMTLRKMLQERGDSVVEFEDGDDALAHLQKGEDTDVVITSLELASGTGLELCWEARLMTLARRPIYSIAMSSTVEDSRLIESLDCGADDFMRKPPHSLELYARMRAAERQIDMQRELIRLADHDPLTGVNNRRAFFDQAEAYCERKAGKEPISVAVIDIDHFKSVNDTFGHAAGDVAICRMAQLASVKGTILGRIGGEEFAMVLPGMRAEAANRALDGLREKVGATRIDTDKASFKITCSIGVSEMQPGDEVEETLQHADFALYDAKRSGRNRVVVYDQQAAATADAG